MNEDSELFLAIDIETVLFKVVIIGQSGTGKTSILERYAIDQFNSNVPATIGIDFFEKKIHGGDKVAKLQIWDTAGQERSAAIPASFIRGAHGIILVFDITDINSFEKIQYWLELTLEHSRGSTIPPAIVLVGNKTDLEEHRKVSISMAQKFAKKNNLIYVEASAKTDTHVDMLFGLLVTNMFDVRHKMGIDTKSLKDTIYIQFEPSSIPKKKNNCCQV